MQTHIKAVLTLIIVSMILMVVPTTAFGMEFSDVPITASYYKAVDKLSNDGVIKGRGDGAFSPSDNTTRAEFCAFVARANNYNEAYNKTVKLPFSDVQRGNWAEGYISFCFQNGYVNGMDDTSFAPTNNVTCEQAIKMVVCSSGVGDESLTKVGPKWYSGYINTARKYNLLDGVVVEIGEPANRAFVAQLVYNSMLVKGEDKPQGSDAVDVGSTNVGRPIEENIPVYEPEEIWEPDPDDVEWNYYQYYGEDYEDYMDSDANNDKYTLPEEPEEEYVYVPRGTSEGMIITIDAGHNYSGVDTGASGNGLREQDITYFIAEKLKPLLERNGFKIVMTRNSLKENVSTESVSASLKRRADIANRSHSDLFISIHCNAGGGTGIETYYCSGSPDGKMLAKFVQEAMTDEFDDLKDRGIKSAGYAVLRNTDMTAILVETGFIDSEVDSLYLADEEYQELYAESIAKGICDYVGIDFK